jgi:hypothetical protein
MTGQPDLLAARIRKLKALADRPGTPGEGYAARAALQRLTERLERERPLIGRTISRSRPCPACSSYAFTVEAGKGPHANHLRCASCGRGGTWMSHAEAAQFEQARRSV